MENLINPPSDNCTIDVHLIYETERPILDGPIPDLDGKHLFQEVSVEIRGCGCDPSHTGHAGVITQFFTLGEKRLA
jgi:hypothetical protein